METSTQTRITVQTQVNVPVAKAWEAWTRPEHITKWCQASDDWHAPYAENDLRTGGSFKTTMAARDGSMSFDFEGVYDLVQPNERIDYTMSDGRKVTVLFEGKGEQTHIIESFVPESTNSHEMQQQGWQGILESFRKYAENLR